MKQEKITFTDFDGREITFTLCVSRERGLYLTVKDLREVFNYDFTRELIEGLEGCSREYLQIDQQTEELITVPMMVDLVYHASDMSIGNLFEWLFAIEKYLVDRLV